MDMCPSSAPLTLVELTNMMLGVELKAKLDDEVDLGFKKIDMMFLVVYQLRGRRLFFRPRENFFPP